MVQEAFVVEALRTPVGKRGGSLSAVHPADLGAHVLKAVFDRTGLDPAVVDDAVIGCLDTIGPQAGNVGRSAWLAAGLPLEVPATTVDRQCGSSQQAIHFAAQGVMSGTQDVVVFGGLQNMSALPISSAMTAGREYGFDDPFTGSKGWTERFGTQEISQFRGAQMIADKSRWKSLRCVRTSAPSRRSRKGSSNAKSFRSATSPSTRPRARLPWRKWRGSSRSPKVGR